MKLNVGKLNVTDLSNRHLMPENGYYCIVSTPA